VAKRDNPQIVPRPELATLTDRTFVLIIVVIEAVLVYWGSKN
jgi:hypothetical protein